MKIIGLFLSVAFVFISCKKQPESPQTKEKQPKVVWKPYDETQDLATTQELEKSRMHLKLVNSKVTDKNDIWKTLEPELDYFSEQKYNSLKEFILEQDIPTIQGYIKEGKLTYEELVLFYIYRIRKFESDNLLSTNGVISLNPKVVDQARELDKLDKASIDINSVFGMPILLKDNINTKEMYTTAGAIALQKNKTDNAFITKRLLAEKALILGKANLSEWAYFFCSGCPVGYSAIGGQTMNPYGRMIFEPGGSSSGSGVTVAANFCVAAVGTETSGSILSPSSQNSIVGLKPTIGVLSRSGIVPISSTLDTPGPMTKNVIDNAILLDALVGKDSDDPYSIIAEKNYLSNLKDATLSKKRFGVFKEFLEDSVYRIAIDKIKAQGAVVIEIEPEQTPLPGFLSILNIDMKKDLPNYILNYGAKDITTKNIEELIAFNQQDSVIRMPYGQQLFHGIVKDETSDGELNKIKENLNKTAQKYFDQHIDTHTLDAILSINNYHAGYAAVAKYPALTVPMGYTIQGEPKGLTFIAKSLSEATLLQLAYAYEKATKERKIPTNFE